MWLQSQSCTSNPSHYSHYSLKVKIFVERQFFSFDTWPIFCSGRTNNSHATKFWLEKQKYFLHSQFVCLKSKTICLMTKFLQEKWKYLLHDKFFSGRAKKLSNDQFLVEKVTFWSHDKNLAEKAKIKKSHEQGFCPKLSFCYWMRTRFFLFFNVHFTWAKVPNDCINFWQAIHDTTNFDLKFSIRVNSA